MPKKHAAEKTVSVSARQLRQAIARRTLAVNEERLLRMKEGLSVSPGTPLERMGQNHPEARARLDELELMAFRAAGHIYGLNRATPHQSKAKDKIVRALRRKIDGR
jgi:Tfp pilus assembly PilM family ATPase